MTRCQGRLILYRQAAPTSIPATHEGVDELPDNDGDTPKDSDDQAGQQEKMPDTNPDSAEFDVSPIRANTRD